MNKSGTAKDYIFRLLGIVSLREEDFFIPFSWKTMYQRSYSQNDITKTKLNFMEEVKWEQCIMTRMQI